MFPTDFGVSQLEFDFRFRLETEICIARLSSAVGEFQLAKRNSLFWHESESIVPSKWLQFAGKITSREPSRPSKASANYTTRIFSTRSY
jgi:hypothetical protein